MSRPIRASSSGPAGSLGLGWAFVERQTNLYKRYWAWELVWLVYGVVNTLAITLIARHMAHAGYASEAVLGRLVLFLMIGTLVWAYASAVLDDVSMVIAWERWEGTIEHTLMAPVPRATHLLGMACFGVAHAVVRTALMFPVALLFFEVEFSRADWLAAAEVLALGSVSIAGLAILTGILPLLYPERGEHMSLMVQAVLLLVSGAYYDVEVLPAWLQPLSAISPATYILAGVRGALIEGRGVLDSPLNAAALVVLALVLVPLSIVVFGAAERWARRAGRLKRSG